LVTGVGGVGMVVCDESQHEQTRFCGA